MAAARRSPAGTETAPFSAKPSCALLADIGGTNARFALLRDGRLGAMSGLKVADYPGPIEAIEAFLAGQEGAPRPQGAALAAAGPTDGRELRMTNAAWHLRAGEIAEAFGMERVVLLHDFAAQALAVRRLEAADLIKVGGGEADPAWPVAVIGPGTGLGMAALLPGAGGSKVLSSEGGHVTMAAVDAREAAILENLRARFGHVSAERLISGSGLVNLYRAMAEIEGREPAESDPAAITAAALGGDAPLARDCLETFCAMLGTVAGNLALTLNARGGVYLAGGILRRFTELFMASDFRRRFEAKGRFADYLADIPCWLITHPEPAFLGLQEAAEEL